MMDIGISGAAGADAAYASNSVRSNTRGDDTDGNGGFLDVLNKAKGDETRPDGNDDGSAASSDAAGEELAAREAAGKRAARPPLIDIQNTGPKAEITDHLQGSVPDKTTGKNVKDTGKSTKEASRTTGHADDPKADAGDGKSLAALIGAVTGNGASGNDDVPDGRSTEDAATSADDGLSSVLAMLKGAENADGALAAQGAGTRQDDVKAGNKQEGTKDSTRTGLADLRTGDTEISDDVSVPGTDSDPTTATFRLSRADGRGQSVDMSIHGQKEESAQFDVKSTQSGQAENVTVLESRRYLGLAQGSNSAAVVSALAGDSEWAQAMQSSSALSNAASWTSTGKVVNTLKIQMHPVELGLVTATLRLSGEELSVDLKVDSPAAYRQLKEDHSRIAEALRSQGYAVDSVTISIAPAARSDAGNQSNFQGQSSHEQSLPNQGQGGEAQSRGQNQAEQRTDRNEGLRNASDLGVEESVSGSAGSSRPGHVYL
ncbi:MULTISPECIES: flagellar hook-length control protein FliK [unclassified Sinorhizobium]|uniref:flagellar hook-length control protein FliK n=1 Tax=unclassified Sinorhizobium TaxID=2613772 RepID=UPI003525226D